jgi:hypothetical protein
LANLAIHRGLTYYYGRRSRPLPWFSDFLASDREERIRRSLGRCVRATGDSAHEPDRV